MDAAAESVNIGSEVGCQSKEVHCGLTPSVDFGRQVFDEL